MVNYVGTLTLENLKPFLQVSSRLVSMKNQTSIPILANRIWPCYLFSNSTRNIFWPLFTKLLGSLLSGRITRSVRDCIGFVYACLPSCHLSRLPQYHGTAHALIGCAS